MTMRTFSTGAAICKPCSSAAARLFAIAMTAALWMAPMTPCSAAEDWRRELDDICARTDESMGLSRAELEGLVFRCRKLQPQIDALDETPKKVYTRRLQMCRDLYVFVLEVLSQQDAAPGGKATDGSSSSGDRRSSSGGVP